MTELPCLVDSTSFPSSIEGAGGEGHSEMQGWTTMLL